MKLHSNHCDIVTVLLLTYLFENICFEVDIIDGIA